MAETKRDKLRRPQGGQTSAQAALMERLERAAEINQEPSALSALDWIRQSPNALTIDIELTEAEWFLLIQSIETIQKRYQWYLGDAMVYGIRREYGATDDQIQRVVDATGKAAATLHEYYKTALLFEFSERSENLDFEQHRVLAKEFSQDTPEHRAERLRWLHVAETGNLSGRKLSAEIAKAQLPAPADGNYSEFPNSSTGDLPALSDEIQEEARDMVLPDLPLDDEENWKAIARIRDVVKHRTYTNLTPRQKQGLHREIAIARSALSLLEVELRRK